MERTVSSAHRQASELLIESVRALDNFFDDERLNEGDLATTRVRVRLGGEIEEGGSSSFTGSVSGQVSLPELSERIQLLIESESSEFDRSGRRIESEKTGFSRDIDFAGSGLRITLYERERLRFTHDTGVRIRSDPKFFSRLRLTNEYLVTDRFLARPTQFVFFDEGRGRWGEQTRLDLDWTLDEASLLRLRNQATFTEESNGVEFFEELTYRRRLADGSGVGVSVSMKAETRPSVVATEYRTGLLYRRLIGWDWLSIQIEPFLKFERERDFDLSPGVTVFFEATFGQM